MRLRRRQRMAGQHWSPPDQVPDNDTVLHPGDRRSPDILRSVLEEETQLVPTYRPRIPAARWRSRCRRS